MAVKEYKIEVADLARGVKVCVSKRGAEGFHMIDEGYCAKRKEIPQCLKDIFAKVVWPEEVS